MIALLLALAGAADGDEVGGFVMGQSIAIDALECREQVCQKPGTVAGMSGTFAVQHCGGIAKTVVFSVSFVPNTVETAQHFGAIAHHVLDPEAEAHQLLAAWQQALQSSGWAMHTEHQDADGSEWVRMVKAPHARLIRVRPTQVGPIEAFTTSLKASATDASCPSP